VSSEHWSLYSRSLVQSRRSGREVRTWSSTLQGLRAALQ
jgi:hypothetical protein